MFTPNVAACVLILGNGVVLGVARRGNPSDWGLPGGKCKLGELSKKAAARELREETGFSVEESDLVEVYRATEEGCLAITFLAKAYEASQRLAGDAGAVAWVTWEELFAGSFGSYNRELKKAVDGIDRALSGRAPRTGKE